MEIENKKFFSFDFNHLSSEPIEIKGHILDRLKEKYPELHSGMVINLWNADITNEKFDPLVCEGILIYDNQTDIWSIKINPEDIKHLSENDKFAGIAIENVLGDKYEEYKDKHPEWF